MGDYNIDIKRKGVGKNNLSDFCDLFDLTNIVKFDTSSSESPLDIMKNAVYFTSKALFVLKIFSFWS